MRNPSFRIALVNLAVAASVLLILLACSARAQMVAGGMDVYAADPTANVARLSDADATCEQLYAEANWLEQHIASLPKPPDPMEAVRQMQEDMQKAQKKMMGGSRAKGLASSLLGMVPGVGGLAAGAVSSMVSAASRPSMDGINETMDKSMKAQQESMAAYTRIATLGARQQHVTDLFLDHSCKVSTLDQNAVARATTHLADSEGKDAGPVVEPITVYSISVPTPTVEEGDAAPAATEGTQPMPPVETPAPEPPADAAIDTAAPD